MNPIMATKFALTRLLDYKGRSSRAEFWGFALIFFGGIILMAVLDTHFEAISIYVEFQPVIMMLGGAFYVPFLLAFVALGVRRLHDTERSGWWMCMIAFHFAAIFLIIMLAQRGTMGPNKFGRDPYNTDIDWDKVERF